MKRIWMIASGVTFFLMLCLIGPLLITFCLQGKEQVFMNHNEIEEREVLIYYLACAIPADYEMETLKAQSVIVRTNLRRTMEAEKKGDLTRLDKIDYARYMEAVIATEGEILTYDQKPIHALYHPVSDGSTKTLESFNGVATPYLQGKNCPLDILSEDFFTPTERSDGTIILKRGKGHGYGFSQFYANEMAREGKNYIDILQYFYTDVELIGE